MPQAPNTVQVISRPLGPVTRPLVPLPPAFGFREEAPAFQGVRRRQVNSDSGPQ